MNGSQQLTTPLLSCFTDIMPWTLSRPEQTILAGQAESSCLSHILLKPQCFRLWGPVQGHSVDSRREKLIPQNKLHSGRLTPTSRASVTWLVAYQSPLLKQANCLALTLFLLPHFHPPPDWAEDPRYCFCFYDTCL